MSGSDNSKPIGHWLAVGLIVAVLVVGGVVLGAKVWPHTVKIERYAAAPSRYLAPLPAEDGLPDLVEKTCPAIAAVEYRSAQDTSAKVGAGIVVSADGFIAASGRELAAYPVVHVMLGDGGTYDASVHAYDKTSGLALLKIDAEKLAVLAFRDSGMPRLATRGVTLSAGLGQGCAVESALIGRDFIAGEPATRAFFRISPASAIAAGTPFISLDGDVLGLAMPSEGDNPAEAGLFLPGYMAARLISEMLRTGKEPNAPFGMLTVGLDPVMAKRVRANRQRGALIIFVRPSSSAEKAGVRSGDLIVSVDGKPVAGASEFGRALDPDAATVEIEFARRGVGRSVRLER